MRLSLRRRSAGKHAFAKAFSMGGWCIYKTDGWTGDTFSIVRLYYTGTFFMEFIGSPGG